jgi:hypothetical protein
MSWFVWKEPGPGPALASARVSLYGGGKARMIVRGRVGRATRCRVRHESGVARDARPNRGRVVDTPLVALQGAAPNSRRGVRNQGRDPRHGGDGERSGGRRGLALPPCGSFVDHEDAPVRCWDDLTSRIAPSLLGAHLAHAGATASLASTWGASRSATAIAETACWDLLARARRATIADLLGASRDRIARGRFGSGGRALSQRGEDAPHHRDTSGRRVSPGDARD